MISSGLVVTLFGVVTAWETWHMVDVAAVICDKPSNVPAEEASQQYQLGLSHSSEIVMDAPYIISFARKSSKKTKITFKVEDAYGDVVIPTTSYELMALSDAVPATCTCTTPTIPSPVSATYGAAYGSKCGDWDNTDCATWWGDENVGSWCCSKWCYASSTCPDAYSSTLVEGQYFSYAACKSEPSSGTCSWTAIAEANDPCKCKNTYSSFTADMKSKFSSTYGESCAAWDMVTCATNYLPSQVDTWCCASWCYVEKSCGSALQSLNDDALFWSDKKCPDDPALTVQCPFKPQPAEAPDCTCLGETIETGFLPQGQNATYGQQCFAHDAEICDQVYPGADYDMWCCYSWCWVDGECKTARASTVWPGHFYSSDHCDMDEFAISSCKYNPSVCECIGTPAALTTNYPDMPSDYGSNCSNWDATGCAARWQDNAYAGWNSSSDHDWCCASWCYISGDCPIAKRSWLSSLASAEVYFSYETCDDLGQTYSTGADTCSRRLSDIEDSLSETADSEHQGAAARMLAARRRSSSPRRRAASPRRRRSPPAPPPASSRRRAPSPPSAPSPRRRSGSTTPRRRDVRRRVPDPRRRAPVPRRRAPVPPAPTYADSRRRATSVSGESYTSSRRRSPDTTADTHRRRRSSPAISYGNSRPQIMYYHNNQMPYPASYGYSGYHSAPADSSVNLATYAAGGFALGFGSAYLLQSMYNDNYDAHRRRRAGPVKWCVVTRAGDSYGDFQECSDCYRLYGAYSCPLASDCNAVEGCAYNIPTDFNRDDLEDTGFVPQDFTWPLTVTFSEISGDDMVKDFISGGLCPPTTPEEIAFAEQFGETMSIKPNLFLVLTKQELLDTGGLTTTSSPARRVSTFWFLAVLISVLAMSRAVYP